MSKAPFRNEARVKRLPNYTGIYHPWSKTSSGRNTSFKAPVALVVMLLATIGKESEASTGRGAGWAARERTLCISAARAFDGIIFVSIFHPFLSFLYHSCFAPRESQNIPKELDSDGQGSFSNPNRRE